jgi:hypothetical protein
LRLCGYSRRIESPALTVGESIQKVKKKMLEKY